MAKILIIGSEGSLMQAVIPHLGQHELYGVDNLQKYGKQNLSATFYDFYKADATEFDQMDNIFREVRPDYVIQAAATIYGVGGFNRYCAEILSNDLALHKNILDCSVHFKEVQKVIYISSSMVYENCPPEPVTENMIDLFPAPYTEYGLSKFVGEKLCEAYRKQYGLKYTIWRPFNIITPHEIASGDIGMSHVFADYIKNIIGEKMNPLPIIGDGEQVRCFTWIDDVAETMAKWSFVEKTDNMTFNLGNPEPITMKDLAYKIHAKAINDQMVEIKPLTFDTVANYDNDVRYRVPDITLAEKFLGFEPKVKLSESLDRCITAYYRSLDW